MRKIIIAAAIMMLAATAFANPFAKADAKAGKDLMDKANCNGACHASLVGGDGTRMYTRAERRVKSADGLRTQVRFCATQLNANWFPEEEENVAAHLNQQYYKFK
ncbi:MAG: cytochrome c [Betaproteobacteria bacterium]|nr:cytochrome c [Betaproteobacteria bacterium]